MAAEGEPSSIPQACIELNNLSNFGGRTLQAHSLTEFESVPVVIDVHYATSTTALPTDRVSYFGVELKQLFLVTIGVIADTTTSIASSHGCKTHPTHAGFQFQHGSTSTLLGGKMTRINDLSTVNGDTVLLAYDPAAKTLKAHVVRQNKAHTVSTEVTGDTAYLTMSMRTFKGNNTTKASIRQLTASEIALLA